MPRRKIRDAAVVGEFFIDEILSGFQSLPKLGEEAFARKYGREVGGGAAITACALGKLGLTVSVFGAVGRKDGSWVEDRLREFSVDTAGLERHPSELTGITVSVSTREDRAFFSYYGANERLPQILNRKATLETLAQSRHIHFACAPDAEHDLNLFLALKKRGCTISVDVQSHFSWLTRPESLALLRHCDIFFPNEREGEWITGESGAHRILRALRDEGIRGVGLKLGGKGAALLWKRRDFLADPHPVESLDTTGAGDSFNAGFLYGMLRHDPPAKCLHLANICGALSTRALGGVAGFPGIHELEEVESQMLGVRA